MVDSHETSGPELSRGAFLRGAGILALTAAGGLALKEWVEGSEGRRLGRAEQMYSRAKEILANSNLHERSDFDSLNSVVVGGESVRTAGYQTKPPEDQFTVGEFYGDEHTVWLFVLDEKGNADRIAPFWADEDTVRPDVAAIEMANHLDSGTLQGKGIVKESP